MLTKRTVEIIYQEIQYLYEDSINQYNKTGNESFQADAERYGDVLIELEETYLWLIPDFGDEDDDDY